MNNYEHIFISVNVQVNNLGPLWASSAAQTKDPFALLHRFLLIDNNHLMTLGIDSHCMTVTLIEPSCTTKMSLVGPGTELNALLTPDELMAQLPALFFFS